MLEMTLAAAMIVQRFDLELAPGHNAEPVPGGTLRPRCGMPMFIRSTT